MDTTDDIDFTADDLHSLRRLEAFMRSRGYRRDRHGFWRLPGEAEYLAIPDSAEDDQ
jgi:hypothetical protein